MLWPFTTMSALQMAYDDGLSSWPSRFTDASGLMAFILSSATESMPPVPAVGSYTSRTTPGVLRSISSLSSKVTISSMTSRGVKCSPAVSLEASANLRMRAAAGIYKTTALIGALEERGVRMSSSQVYRLVTDAPERLNLHALVALMDILQCSADDLIRPVQLGASVPLTGTD